MSFSSDGWSCRKQKAERGNKKRTTNPNLINDSTVQQATINPGSFRLKRNGKIPFPLKFKNEGLKVKN